MDTDGPDGKRTASHRWAWQAREIPKEDQDQQACTQWKNDEESGLQP